MTASRVRIVGVLGIVVGFVGIGVGIVVGFVGIEVVIVVGIWYDESNTGSRLAFEVMKFVDDGVFGLDEDEKSGV
ncbi:hypothetical protein Tco_0025062 [Tanacetum coccineum]